MKWQEILKKARPFAVALGITVVFVISLPWILNYSGNTFFKRQSYEASRFVWGIAAPITWHERDIAYSNEGDAAFELKAYQDAIKKFETASKYAPSSRICKIRFNWALSYKTLALQEKEQNNLEEAITNMSNALRIATDNQCSSDESMQELLAEIIKELAELTKQTEKKDKPDDENKKKSPPEERLEDRSEVEQQQREFKESQSSEQGEKYRNENVDTSRIAW